ncbi:ImpA family type VI secretion system protein [Erwinia sp. AnSW2-5]|uniref:type VI secretion system protein TssA n=1 Tax=Erwinia sp. AnSW2-5 TaxID=3367692 RepID=UPI00385AF94B
MSDITITEISQFYSEFLQPVSDEFPCGDSLEYDSAFILLLSKIQPKQSAEYGNFVEQAEPVNWSEVQRECATLMQKSKDVRLFIIMIRCRLRKIGLIAIEEGISSLKALIEIFPEQYYPLLFDEGDFEPLMRANAFSELDDASGLITDLRNHKLPKAAGQIIILKDFEKSFATPREPDALPDAMISAMQEEWNQQADKEIISLSRAAKSLQAVRHSLRGSLGEDAPELPIITHLLTLFSSSSPAVEDYLNEPESDELHLESTQSDNGLILHEATEDVVQCVNRPPSASQNNNKLENRQDALALLVEIRMWFTRMEPSSPVILLLELTESMVGKRFTELMKILPSELITKMDSENT